MRAPTQQALRRPDGSSLEFVPIYRTLIKTRELPLRFHDPVNYRLRSTFEPDEIASIGNYIFEDPRRCDELIAKAVEIYDKHDPEKVARFAIRSLAWLQGCGRFEKPIEVVKMPMNFIKVVLGAPSPGYRPPIHGRDFRGGA
jgi:hypothetical protein